MKKGLLVLVFFAFTSFMVLNAQGAKVYCAYFHPLSIQQTRDGGYVVVGTFFRSLTKAYDAFSQASVA